MFKSKIGWGELANPNPREIRGCGVGVHFVHPNLGGAYGSLPDDTFDPPESVPSGP